MLVPALGGRVRDVQLGGRQWLWHNPHVPFTTPPAGVSYDDAAAAGGFDECFPTVEPCRLPSWVKGAQRAKLPDHGELWAQPPAVEIVTDADGHSATCTWSGSALPYRFTRRMTLHPEGWLAFSYAATNTGEHRIPFLWSSHPVFPLTPRTRLVLPDRAPVRVWSQHNTHFGKQGSQHRWPRMRNGGSLVDLSRPFDALGGDYACKLFVELPRAEVRVLIEEGDAQLEILLHGREIPTLGVSINRSAEGAAPRRGRWRLGRQARPAACTLSVEPSIGAPESLSDALGAWDDAHWLEPGGTARWGMTWRAGPKTEDRSPMMEDA